MGYFSWKTQDTNKSISNRNSCRGTFGVVMSDDKGNQWEEYDYEGYGVFGGKDYFELLAEMNELPEPCDRIAGIQLSNSGKFYIAPNLTETPNWVWRNDIPEMCEYQGYFYDEHYEDNDYYDDQLDWYK